MGTSRAERSNMRSLRGNVVRKSRIYPLLTIGTGGPAVAPRQIDLTPELLNKPLSDFSILEECHGYHAECAKDVTSFIGVTLVLAGLQFVSNRFEQFSGLARGYQKGCRRLELKSKHRPRLGGSIGKILLGDGLRVAPLKMPELVDREQVPDYIARVKPQKTGKLFDIQAMLPRGLFARSNVSSLISLVASYFSIVFPTRSVQEVAKKAADDRTSGRRKPARYHCRPERSLIKARETLKKVLNLAKPIIVGRAVHESRI